MISCFFVEHRRAEQVEFPFVRRTELIPLDTLYTEADTELFGRLREDRRFERKSVGIHTQNLGDYLSMFANSAPDGGMIAIGIEDDGPISGCLRADPKHLNELERSGDIYCPDARYQSKRVTVRNASDEDDFVLLFRVQYRPDKVVETTRGDAFIKRGESKRKLNDDEKRELRIAKHEVDLEQESCPLSYPEDFDLNLIHQFANNFRRNANVT
ncbi:MAG TPA: ATP-binding protein, partial [Candidatus Binataceae bacterium]|nr:ATP-binding protein [Candidatus Binataceae bacterium]